MKRTMVLLALLIAVAIAPCLSPYGVDEVCGKPFEPPSPIHPLGTDDMGRDVLTQLLYATRHTVAVAILATALSLAIGVPLGIVSPLIGGAIDVVIEKILASFMAIPGLLLATAVAYALAIHITMHIPGVAIAIASTSWYYVAWVIRSSARQIATEQFVESCRAIGSSATRIAFRHILPNTIEAIAACALDVFARSAILDAYLGFLGLYPFSEPSLGKMIRRAIQCNAILLGYWWLVVPPCIALSLITLAIAFTSIDTEKTMS